MFRQKACIAATVLGLTATGASAAIVAGPYSGWQNIDYQAPLGQTFTAQSTPISKIGFWVTDMGAGKTGNLEISLYNGVGFGGTLLSTKTVAVSGVGSFWQGWATAWFSGVDLVGGRTYSLKLTDGSGTPQSGGDWYVSWAPWGSEYGGGTDIFKGVPTNWTDIAFCVLDAYVTNSKFSNADLSGWTSQTSGIGSTGAVYVSPSNYAAQLVAGSPVSISQTIKTPAEPFGINLDYSFKSAGVLEVLLADQVVARVERQEAGGFVNRVIGITQPNLLGQTAASLKLRFDGETGSAIWLDNIYLTDVPEPSAIVLLAVGGILFARRRKP